MKSIEYYLEKLEQQINPSVEEDLITQWESFWNGGISTEFFSPVRQPVNCSEKFPSILINDALNDPEKMLLRELALCSNVLASKTGKILNIRCNYGTGILPSLFGTELFLMAPELDTLPSARHLGGDTVKKRLDAGLPDLNNGLGAKVWETAAYYQDVLKNYPSLSRHIHIYHPDLQGPLDALELIRGSDFFLDIYDDPEFVRDLLELITSTYISFMKKWDRLVHSTTQTEFSPHWGMWIKGRIMLRNDSAVNLSAEMYDEFVRPYDERILNEFGGGAVHYCGKGDHFVRSLCEMSLCYGIHLSQPHLNNMDSVLRGSVEEGKRILWLDRLCVEQLQRQGRSLRGLVCQGEGNL